MKSSISSLRCRCSGATLRSTASRSHRYASTSTSSSSSSSTSTSATPSTSPKSPKTRWLAITLVSVAAAGAGAYIRSQTPGSATLNQETFTKYSLVSREPVSSTSSLFTLRPRYHSDGNYDVYEEAWRTGVWSVMFKQPQLQIGRDYTPLPTTAATSLSVDEENEGYLRFFIRKDPFGEVSRYLHTLEPGADIELRGPQIECAIPQETREILFIAGGTGIAPALQAGYSLLHRTKKNNRPRIHIIWASRLRADCVGGVSDTPKAPAASSSRSWFSGWFGSSSSGANASQIETASPVSPGQEQSLIVRELEALKSQYPGQITVDYYLDEENRFIGKNDLAQFIKPTTETENQETRKLILVSGPEGFISYMAGPKVWAQGTELQGPLKGIIKELDPKGWAVWKL
ncbi:putative cytochrome c import factor (Cyc2) [Penicillium brasilianum]|uniref:Putative cytochrome c import factor (Cyc2) n=1 Tax=Penicillium brasilianum TaxID=104259 RepID=A0A1S9S142_PENBI|nr:putative cytochrome c import factor (Cyc2) [Penicillium brasilianum]